MSVLPKYDLGDVVFISFGEELDVDKILFGEVTRVSFSHKMRDFLYTVDLGTTDKSEIASYYEYELYQYDT